MAMTKPPKLAVAQVVASPSTLAALHAGHQAALLPCRRDEIATADAVRPDVVRCKGIGKGTLGRYWLVLRLLRLGNPWSGTNASRDLGCRLYRLERRQQRLPTGHEMADHWGRDRARSGLFSRRQCWGGAALEALRPGCGMRRLRRGCRAARSAVDNLNDAALACDDTTPPRSDVEELLILGRGEGPRRSHARKDAISFGHVVPDEVGVARRRQRRQNLGTG